MEFGRITRLILARSGGRGTSRGTLHPGAASDRMSPIMTFAFSTEMQNPEYYSSVSSSRKLNFHVKNN